MEEQIRDEITKFSEGYINSFNKFLKKEIKKNFANTSATLYKAIEYSLTSSGKRIRPLLFLTSSASFNCNHPELYYFACGIEMIHTYTLVHDDLPAIDDDTERRGIPTTHVVYGEGIAILVGDTLLTEGTRYLLHPELRKIIGSETVIEMADLILSSVGTEGITVGQIMDKLYEGKNPGEKKIKEVYSLKTGYFIGSSIACGYLAAGGKDKKTISELIQAGVKFGIAYQVANDIYDSFHKKKDEEKQKATLVQIYGKDKARKFYEDETYDVFKKLAKLTEPGSPVVMALQYIDDLIQKKWVY